MDKLFIAFKDKNSDSAHNNILLEVFIDENQKIVVIPHAYIIKNNTYKIGVPKMPELTVEMENYGKACFCVTNAICIDN